ncbi:NUDIX hydrolase [Staphylococcus aureus]|nr:NUDIX hydrolase [Staphylococcus aureus]
MSKFDEQIIVVPREIIFNNEKNTFNGFLNKNKPEGQNIF